MKRIVLAVALGLVMAAMLAPSALAQEPVEGKTCTFKDGKTTCTETVFLYSEYVTTEVAGGGTWYCNNVDPQVVDFVGDYYVNVYEITTTVYKGKSNKVLSTDTTQITGVPYLDEASIRPVC